MSYADLYIGTYTQGIYHLRFWPATGECQMMNITGRSENPSFLAVAPTHLYAVNELEHRSAITTYRIEANGALTFLKHTNTPGTAMCHLEMGRNNQAIYAANYLSGHVLACPILNDGTAGTPISVFQHQGHSVNTNRQESQHAHSVNLDPSGQYLLAADLGMDQIVVYQVNPTNGRLAPAHSISVSPGEGPRHMAFHPGGGTVYLVTELGNSVITYQYGNGHMEQLQALPLLPEDFTGESLAADIHLSPDGRFLYASNRGHDSITLFKVLRDGTLKRLGWISSGGSNPRNFCISPDGSYLVAANQNSNAVVFFPRISETGWTGEPVCKIAVPKPVCVKWKKAAPALTNKDKE